MQSAGAGDWLLYRRLLAPTVGDDGAVTTLAGVMVLRDYREDARAE